MIIECLMSYFLNRCTVINLSKTAGWFSGQTLYLLQVMWCWWWYKKQAWPTSVVCVHTRSAGKDVCWVQDREQRGESLCGCTGVWSLRKEWKWWKIDWPRAVCLLSMSHPSRYVHTRNTHTHIHTHPRMYTTTAHMFLSKMSVFKLLKRVLRKTRK